VVAQSKERKKAPLRLRVAASAEQGLGGLGVDGVS
jgi:hypothetical protein